MALSILDVPRSGGPSTCSPHASANQLLSLLTSRNQFVAKIPDPTEPRAPSRSPATSGPKSPAASRSPSPTTRKREPGTFVPDPTPTRPRCLHQRARLRHGTSRTSDKQSETPQPALRCPDHNQPDQFIDITIFNAACAPCTLSLRPDRPPRHRSLAVAPANTPVV